jgi:phosphatidylglycerophosphate synthase
MNQSSDKKNLPQKEEKHSGQKVIGVSYIDLSDYARPAAIWIANKLQDTSIHVYHITIFHFLLMLLAAFVITKAGFLAILLASVLLLVKNMLDAVDGSLARMRNKPSRVGRFLDSNLDFVGNFFLFLALVDIPIWMRLFSFFCFILQGSFFNYYYILFRKSHGGDTTSKVKEDDTSTYQYDNPTALRILYFFYRLFYQWQDVLVMHIDQQTKNEKRTISPFFISCLSINGLGFQYIIIIILLLLHQQQLIPVWFVVIMNIYLAILLLLVNRNGETTLSKREQNI